MDTEGGVMTTETSRDLDARVAERVMGTPVLGVAGVCWPAGEATIVGDDGDTQEPICVGACNCDVIADLAAENPGDRYWTDRLFGHHHHCLEVVPAYSTDPAAARLVEDEIERRGLWRAYTEALLLAVIDLPPGVDTIFEGWALIRATPEARCRAALVAVGEG
jgi:hypothetical protein